MSVTFATKSCAGTKRVLRPASDVNALVVNHSELVRPFDEVTPDSSKIVRTNLDGTVLGVQKGWRARNYAVAVKVLDELPVDYTYTAGYYDNAVRRVDRFGYLRKGALSGVYLYTDVEPYAVAGVESAIQAIEAITSATDRTVVILPASVRHLVEAQVQVLRGQINEDWSEERSWRDKYDTYSRTWNDALLKACEVVDNGFQRTLVKQVVLGLVDAAYFRTPFTVRWFGKEPSLQEIRDEAHAEAIKLVAAERVRINTDRFSITQDIAKAEEQLRKVLQTVADNARGIADQHAAFATMDTDGILAAYAERFNRPITDAVSGVEYSKTPERLAQEIEYLRRTYKALGAESIRKVVLPGEED